MTRKSPPADNDTKATFAHMYRLYFVRRACKEQELNFSAIVHKHHTGSLMGDVKKAFEELFPEVKHDPTDC